MMERVETWEAAALSFNLEPCRIDRNKNSSFPDDKTYDLFVRFWRAVEVAPWRALGRNQLGVCLPSFAEWSISKGMDIPAELASMARPIEAPEVPAPEPVVSILVPMPVRAHSSGAIHRIQTKDNLMKPVIELAKQTAIDSASPSSVWAELVKLAEDDKRPAPLLGFVDGEGVKYQGQDGPTFFTSKNLRDRMRRERNKTL